jgi:hypothetical protein
LIPRAEVALPSVTMRTVRAMLASLTVLAAAARTHGEPRAPEYVETLAADEPLYDHPTTASARRGALLAQVPVAVLGRTRGPGCTAEWLLVGPHAWLCGDRTRTVSSARAAPRHAAVSRARHYFVGASGSLGYKDLDSAESAEPDAEYDPGFAVSVTRVRAKHSGEAFALTTRGLWLPLRDLVPVKLPSANGVQLAGELDVGWVVSERAPLHEPTTAARTSRTLPRQAWFRTRGTFERGGRRFYLTDSGAWIDARHAVVPDPATPPATMVAGERWLDIDRRKQVLVAYEGSRPVFAALVSTGKGRPNGPFATPPGEFRIWVKLRTSNMTNLEDADANGYYAMEDVPWVMFFNRGFGLHGAFWHDSFGRVRSHGCVNLAPADAHWLFEWAGPHLPTSWSAALPTPSDPGTLVRIR